MSVVWARRRVENPTNVQCAHQLFLTEEICLDTLQQFMREKSVQICHPKKGLMLKVGHLYFDELVQGRKISGTGCLILKCIKVNDSSFHHNFYVKKK
jgi:hypothetical protein